MKCVSFKAATVTTFTVFALAAHDDSRLYMTVLHTGCALQIEHKGLAAEAAEAVTDTSHSVDTEHVASMLDLIQCRYSQQNKDGITQINKSSLPAYAQACTSMHVSIAAAHVIMCCLCKVGGAPPEHCCAVTQNKIQQVQHKWSWQGGSFQPLQHAFAGCMQFRRQWKQHASRKKQEEKRQHAPLLLSLTDARGLMVLSDCSPCTRLYTLISMQGANRRSGNVDAS